jgi:hypothetical protein
MSLTNGEVPARTSISTIFLHAMPHLLHEAACLPHELAGFSSIALQSFLFHGSAANLRTFSIIFVLQTRPAGCGKVTSSRRTVRAAALEQLRCTARRIEVLTTGTASTLLAMKRSTGSAKFAVNYRDPKGVCENSLSSLAGVPRPQWRGGVAADFGNPPSTGSRCL